MLAHLPGRTSQPSRKGVTSNIFILRCSFHETAKRLSITSLTHLSRLRSKIQSSIVRHNKHVTIWLQLYDMWFCYKWKKKYEVSQTTLNCQCDWQICHALFQNGDTKKKSRTGLLHRNQFAEGIQLTWTIISKIYRKKKDLPKSANDTIIYRLSLWYNNNERLSCLVTQSRCILQQGNSTLDAPKNLWMTSKRHPIKPIMLS